MHLLKQLRTWCSFLLVLYWLLEASETKLHMIPTPREDEPPVFDEDILQLKEPS